ncbi:MAG: AsmA family protein, partial [Burkholderiales bacterium]
MRNPLNAWRAGTRWPLILLSLLVALIITIGICEGIGWPFLIQPLQNAASKALGRKVVLGQSEDDHTGVKLHLLGSVRLRAPALEISSPTWSEAPHMLQVRDAFLKLGYFDLWHAYKGQPLHIKALEAAELDANLQRQKDGQASWEFNKKEEQPAPDEQKRPAAALPTFDSLRVEAGHLAYQDEVLPAKIDANFALRDRSGSAAQDQTLAPASTAASTAASASASASATATAAAQPAKGESAKAKQTKSAGKQPGLTAEAGDDVQSDGKAPSAALADGETGLRLEAVGTYQKLPVKVSLRTTGALSLLAEGKTAVAQPVRLSAVAGKTTLSFDGTTTDPLHLTALSGDFTGGGPSLASVGDALGVTLPETPSFKVNGQLDKQADVWRVKLAEARIGLSHLSGEFSYDKGRKTPLLSGKLAGKRLVLNDLGPSVGTAPADAQNSRTKRRGKVFPDKRFDLPSLGAMDADIQVDIGEFDTGTDVLAVLEPLRAHLLLADSVLTLADIKANAAKGQLIGSLQLDGRGKQAKWDANLGLRGVDMAQMLKLERKGKSPPYLSGKLDAKVDVKGSGRSTAEILGSLDGQIKAHMRNASISHLAIEAGGLDIAQALGVLIKGDDSLKIQCNIIDLTVKRGLIQPKLLVLNTSDSTMWIDGLISLKTEAMGLKAIVAPKDFSPLTLRAPIKVEGTLSDPSVSIESGKLAAKAGAAALLALVTPLAAVLPFVDTGS